MKLPLTLFAVFAAGCATVKQQCDPDNKSEYCQDLRRGKTQDIPSPAIPRNSPRMEPYRNDQRNGVPVDQHPLYKPEGQ